MFWVLFLLLLLKTVIYDMTTREWLLFSANSTIFQLYHGENKLIFNEMMMRSAELDLYSASSLKQQSMGRHQGRIQDFVLGGVVLKKNCAERREARKYLGYFVWKITILRQKSYLFQF